ncbi:MAG: peptidoglycan-binding protein, partial [Candidatus Pacebacteria bacterium]|nr:peptidoglycan-binding protein [Candidatus Paceibacterota bacterium]
MKKILGIFAAFLFLNIGMVFASEIPADFCFNLNLEEGDQGEDVKYLQVLLNRDSETQIAESGAGSPQNETNYFGALTKKAVIKFQEKHFDDILKPWGFKNGTGIVGATTRAKLNGFFSKEALLPQDIQISDLTPFQGETLIIKINNVREGEKITAEFNNNDFEFYPINSDIEEIVVLPISAKAQIGKHPLTIKS